MEYKHLKQTFQKQKVRIINLLIDGFVLREAARYLKMPKATVVNCMENFCYQDKTVIE